MPEQKGLTLSDAGLAIVLAGFGLWGTAGASLNQDMGLPDARAYVLVALTAGSLVFRRASPWVTFVVTGAALTLYLGWGYAYGPILIIGLLAIYSLASRVPVRRGVIASVTLVVAVEVATVVGIWRGDREWSELLTAMAWVVVPAAVGIAVRIRRGSVAEVRAAQARRAVSEEQLRMAQELHDSVGHGLAVIAMQAGVALHVLNRDPRKARDSLEAIRATSREALDGLRAELAALRASGDPDAAPRRPRSGLADLGVLVDRVRAGGVEIVLRKDATAGVPADVDAAAYRILQESLTNVLRHARTDAAEVSVRRETGALVLEVADRGIGARGREGQASLDGDPGDDVEAGHGGTGIIGMRSRAETLGGTLEAGPRPGGGFLVRARLPFERPRDLRGSAS